jgi:hypothetical protein
VRQAFLKAYTGIKPTDGVVVGLFPKHADQVRLDLEYAAEACRAADDNADRPRISGAAR